MAVVRWIPGVVRVQRHEQVGHRRGCVGEAPGAPAQEQKTKSLARCHAVAVSQRTPHKDGTLRACSRKDGHVAAAKKGTDCNVRRRQK